MVGGREVVITPEVYPTPMAPNVLRFMDDEIQAGGFSKESFEQVRARTREFGIKLSADEVILMVLLRDPARIQRFFDSYLNYNHDHASVDQEETAMAPRLVFQTGMAHCFEGALVATMALELNNKHPKWVLIEASKDVEHNLVLVQDTLDGSWSVVDQPEEPDGSVRLGFPTSEEAVESYYPTYVYDKQTYPNLNTMVGYSRPFRFIEKFEARWMESRGMLWKEYYLLINSGDRFVNVFDRSGKEHLHPHVRAIQEGLIAWEGSGRPVVVEENLGNEAGELWRRFKELGGFDKVPPFFEGELLELEVKFKTLIGMTPVDLEHNREMTGDMIDHGVDPRRLVIG